MKRRNFVLTVGDVGVVLEGDVEREAFSELEPLVLLEERRRISSSVCARLTLREESRSRYTEVVASSRSSVNLEDILITILIVKGSSRKSGGNKVSRLSRLTDETRYED